MAMCRHVAVGSAVCLLTAVPFLSSCASPTPPVRPSPTATATGSSPASAPANSATSGNEHRTPVPKGTPASGKPSVVLAPHVPPRQSLGVAWPSLLQPGDNNNTGGSAGNNGTADGAPGGPGTSPPPGSGGVDSSGGDSAGADGSVTSGATAGATSDGDSSAPGAAAAPDASRGWFAYLVARDCSRVTGGSRDEAVLVEALRAVCPAVVAGGRPDWAVAGADIGRIGAPARAGCWGAVGYALLTRLLALHRAHPHAVFHVTSPAAGQSCEPDG